MSDIVNSLFNLREHIPNSKVVRKILRSLLKRFRPKVITIEESRDTNSMTIDVLVSSIQTYEITLPNSQKPKYSTFKPFENEKKDTKKLYNITREKLAHMVKMIIKVMKFNRKFYKNLESGKRKRLKQSSKVKNKSSSKGKKIECFNCHKDIKKSL